MREKLIYKRPSIFEVELDAVASLVCGSEENPSNPGGNPVTPLEGSQATTSSFKEEDDSGINENPFNR